MLRFGQFVQRLWRLRSLSSKLLLPIAGLMLVSLFVSVVAFVIGIARTEEQLLNQQTSADMDSIENALNARIQIITTATQMLDFDHAVAEAPQTDNLSLLNSRAVVVRD